MPLPLAAVPPAGAALAGAAAASKAFAIHAAPFIYDSVSTLSSATLAAWLLRYFWKNKVPEWAKQDVSFQNLLRPKKNHAYNERKGHGADASEENQHEALLASEREEREMASLASVLEKVQALIDSVQLEDDHPSIIQQNAAFLAYIQLSAQIKRQEQSQQAKQKPAAFEEKKDEEVNANVADFWSSRDSLYENAKPSPTVSSSCPLEYHAFIQNPNDSPVKTTLQQALSFATYAYHSEPDILAEKLGHDYELLDHSLSTTKPGHVAYYLAVSSASKKQLVIGLRGTTTLEDLLTDTCGRSIAMDDRPYYYDHDRGTKLNRMHNDQQDFSSVEVQAASPLRVVHAHQYRDENDDENINGSPRQQGTEVVEVISGHERIWVEKNHAIFSELEFSTPNTKNNHLVQDDYLPRCHEGIYLSAKRLVDRVQEQVEHWVVQRGYQLVLCGHSLGAGCASLAAVILRSRLPELTHGSLASSPKMRVYCFAPPPVLDRDSALAASSYCTSVVNNADMIPRCSLENLLILLEVLKGVWEELKRQDLAPTGPTTFASFFRKIAKGSADEDMLMSASSLRALMLDAMEKVQANQRRSAGTLNQITASEGLLETQQNDPTDNTIEETADDRATEVREYGGGFVNPAPLYIPGIVLFGYEPWCGSKGPLKQNDDAPCPNIDESEEATVQDDGSNSSADGSGDGPPSLNISWNITDGTDRVLRVFEDASSRMAFDHATMSYYSLLDLHYEF